MRPPWPPFFFAHPAAPSQRIPVDPRAGKNSSFCTIFVQCKSFRMNTCKSVSKQRTLTSFRMNTYKKHGGEGVTPCKVKVQLELRSQVLTRFTHSFRSRGPSNSQRKTPCQRPSASFPPSTGTVWLTPTSTALMCASELPSLWRYVPVAGTSRSSAPSTSRATSGSAHSLMVIPAVVCGTYK